MTQSVEGLPLSQLLQERPSRLKGLRRGYRVEDVDVFFDHIAQAVPAGRVASGQVRAVGFGSQFGGYDVADTDALLAEIEDGLARRERQRSLAQSDQRPFTERQAALGAAVSGRLKEPRGERFPAPAACAAATGRATSTRCANCSPTTSGARRSSAPTTCARRCSVPAGAAAATARPPSTRSSTASSSSW